MEHRLVCVVIGNTIILYSYLTLATYMWINKSIDLSGVL